MRRSSIDRIRREVEARIRYYEREIEKIGRYNNSAVVTNGKYWKGKLDEATLVSKMLDGTNDMWIIRK